jgi:hypothetical protein
MGFKAVPGAENKGSPAKGGKGVPKEIDHYNFINLN